MATPNVLVIAGYGLNCEEETLFAFTTTGATGKIIHINDIIANPSLLENYQILAIPGGFSYGDDTGSGNALANRIRHNLKNELSRFVEADHLVIGICNGCQTLVNLGLVPATEGISSERQAALLHNANFRYQCRWVDVKVDSEHCVWTKGINQMHIPVAHGEGNFAMAEEMLKTIEAKGQVAMRYTRADGTAAGGVFPANPNGSLADIAALTDTTGRILAVMPHPERALFFTQRDDWHAEADKLKRNGTPLPEHGDGLALFRNAVSYFE